MEALNQIAEIYSQQTGMELEFEKLELLVMNQGKIEAMEGINLCSQEIKRMLNGQKNYKYIKLSEAAKRKCQQNELPKKIKEYITI